MTSAPAPTPPTDPRAAWGLPAFGSMARVAHLDEVVARVLAPNPDPMTLDGTNTYLVGAPTTGAVAVIDPGPRDAEHLDRVREVVAARDAEVAAVLVTHHHHDHLAAAADWAVRFGAPLHVTRPQDAASGTSGLDAHVIADGDVVRLPGCAIAAVATPGHTRDHVAYRLEHGPLLTGDHVLGRGTSVVAHPDGDLPAYLESLRRVLELGPDALYPGHGPALHEDPDAVVRFYLDHRDFRRRQVLAALAEGPHTPRGLVERIYAAVDPRLWGAAEASTRALLQGLVAEGTVDLDAHDRVHLRT